MKPYSFRAECQLDVFRFMMALEAAALVGGRHYKIVKFLPYQDDLTDVAIELATTFQLDELIAIAASIENGHVMEQTLCEGELGSTKLDRNYTRNYEPPYPNLCICWIPEEVSIKLRKDTPEYLKNEIEARGDGTVGRSRLWIPPDFPLIDVSEWFEYHPKTPLVDYSGILMKRKDIPYIFFHPCIGITDVSMNPLEAKPIVHFKG